MPAGIGAGEHAARPYFLYIGEEPAAVYEQGCVPNAIIVGSAGKGEA